MARLCGKINKTAAIEFDNKVGIKLKLKLKRKEGGREEWNGMEWKGEGERAPGSVFIPSFHSSSLHSFSFRYALHTSLTAHAPIHYSHLPR